jgi:hypothetical protein
MPKELTRITADFSPEAYQTLNEVADLMNTTKADVLRRSLGLLRFVLQEQKEGRKIVIEDGVGTVRKEIVTL